jgi:hypothetical protein
VTPDGGDGHAQQRCDAGELEAGRDAGELRARGAEVGDQQRDEQRQRPAHAVALPYERHQPAPRDHAHARSELVEEDQRRGRGREHPQQAVAVVGAADRVRRDPGGIVVGESRQQPRTEHGDERDEAAAPQQAAARKMMPASPASVQMPHVRNLWGGGRSSVRECPHRAAGELRMAPGVRGRTVDS